MWSSYGGYAMEILWLLSLNAKEASQIKEFLIDACLAMFFQRMRDGGSFLTVCIPY
jgi:hypothetical protein